MVQGSGIEERVQKRPLCMKADAHSTT